MSGMIVDRRDQVLITVFLPDSLRTSTFLSRWSSTKGPFFRLRGIPSLPSCSALLTGATTPDDELVACLAAAGTAFGLTSRVHRVATTGGLALTTTVRVVDRVHGDTTHRGLAALPAHAAGLAPVDVGVLGVADLADRGAAAHVHVADLARGHPQLGVRTVLGYQLHLRAGGAGDLCAAPRGGVARAAPTGGGG